MAARTGKSILDFAMAARNLELVPDIDNQKWQEMDSSICNNT